MRLFILYLLIVITCICCNQKAIPKVSTENFMEMEPNAERVSWTYKRKLCRVEYLKEGRTFTSYFTGGGVWLETEKEIYREELPPEILKVVESRLYDYEIVDLEYVITKDNQKLYEVDLRKDGKIYDMLFDQTGKILRRKL